MILEKKLASKDYFTLKFVDLQPVTLLTGHPYLLSELVSRLSHPLSDWNVSRYAGEVNLGERLSELNSMPFGGGPRLVIWDNPDLTAKKPKEYALFETYLANPSPYALLLLVQEKPDQRSKWYKDLTRSGLVLNMGSSFKRSDWLKFLQVWLQEEQWTSQEGVLESLFEQSADDIGLALAELKKIQMYVGDKKKIEMVDLMAVGATAPSHDVFAFTNALVEGKIQAASEYFYQAIDQGEAVIPLFALTVRQVSKMARAVAFSQEGMSSGELARALQVPPFVVRSYVEGGRRIGMFRLSRFLMEAPEVDYRLKRGSKADLVMQKIWRLWEK